MEYKELKELQKNGRERIREGVKEWHDYVTDIDYKGHKVNLAEYVESREHIYKKAGGRR